MNRSKALHTMGVAVLGIVSALLGVGFAVIGVAKFSPPWPDMFAGWGFPAPLAYVIGVIEVGAGLMLLIPRTAIPGATALSIVMIGATLTHIAHGERNWSFTLIILAVLSGIAVQRYRTRYTTPASPETD